MNLLMWASKIPFLAIMLSNTPGSAIWSPGPPSGKYALYTTVHESQPPRPPWPSGVHQQSPQWPPHFFLPPCHHSDLLWPWRCQCCCYSAGVCGAEILCRSCKPCAHEQDCAESRPSPDHVSPVRMSKSVLSPGWHQTMQALHARARVCWVQAGTRSCKPCTHDQECAESGPELKACDLKLEAQGRR